MRTIQFSVDDETYSAIQEFAKGVGISGNYAASILARMLVSQAVGLPDSQRFGIFTSFTYPEYLALMKYVGTKMGYAGPNPVATFMHKAAFDTMARYPAKQAETKQVGSRDMVGVSRAAAVPLSTPGANQKGDQE